MLQRKKPLLCALLALLGGAAPAAAEPEKPRLAVISNDFVLRAKFTKMSGHLERADLAFRHHSVERSDNPQLAATLEWADWVIVDAPRSADAQAIGEVMSDFDNATPTLIVSARGPRSNGFDEEQTRQLYDYYRNGGATNFHNLGRYLAALHTGAATDTVPAPVVLPDSAYYHPELEDGFTRNLQDYPGWQQAVAAGRPIVGIVFHHSWIGNLQTAPLEDLLARIDELGGFGVALFVPMMGSPGALPKLVMSDDTAVMDALINFQVMYAGERTPAHQRMGIPVLQGIVWRAGDIEHWRNDPVGIGLSGVPFYLAMPEAVGATDPLVVAAVDEGQTVTIPEQMQSLAAKAVNLARLQDKPAADRRLALFYYNYPQGENNLSASFLNVPRSLEQLTATLAQADYEVEAMNEDTLIEHGTAMLRPFYHDDALSDLLERDLAVSYPVAAYRAWFETLPESVRQEVNERWGQPEESPMVETIDGQPHFIIPRLQNGNLMILPQPPRGRRDEPSETSIYHDTLLPLNHFYMAVYAWVRGGFGADAIIHFGTHGTQEWTPGKERGLGIDEYPYTVLGDVPVFYPYIVDNIGEATQAKRRGRATIISHQTPPFRPAGLRQALMPVHDLIHEYQLLDRGPVRQQTRQAIIEETLGNDLFEDLGWTREQAVADFEVFQTELHDYLHQLARQAQPLGLHALGVDPNPEHRLASIMQMLGDDYYKALALDDVEERFADTWETLAESEPMRFLERHLIEGQTLGEDASPALVEQLDKARRFDDKLDTRPELDGLLRALDGHFIAPANGGDPIRNPDSLPTGRNLYGFDPSRLPTQQAWETGRRAVESLIEQHHDEHGEYPRKLAFSLWAVEAMRHLGVLEAQVFAALGTRPTWDDYGRVSGFEIIAREQLGRPRVDVVLSATGLYRDQFPNVMAHLTQAVAAVAKLDEPDNPLHRSARALERELLAAGYEPGTAREMAVTRLFTGVTGSYGTGLDDAAMATDSWESDDKLAEMFIDRMQYAYGPDPENWGRREDGQNLFARQLVGVEGAVLARSSNLYGMLTTDDPFQYLGGLSLAVRHLTGQSPQLHISNLRDASNPRYESAARFLSSELRTRQFHPGWIEAMQAEGYAGTLELVESLNNFWGWQVTDPDVVRDSQWQQFHDVYVADTYDMDMREWFEQSNPHALAQMVERMLEAVRKDYWQADDETVASLAETLETLQSEYDTSVSSPALERWLEEQGISGYGLSGPAPSQPAAGSNQAVEVQGQQLAVSSSDRPDPAISRAWLLLLPLLLVLVTGAGWQLRRQRTAAAMTSGKHSH